MRKIMLLLLVFFVWIYFWLMENKFEDEHDVRVVIPSVEIDLDSIKARGKLIALTRYSTNSFFIYRGQPMGYEYELLKLFAKEIGVDLEIKIPSTADSLYIMLEEGSGDLIAANLAITKEMSEHILFSEHHNTMRQVLVQKLPENYRFMNAKQKREALIQDPIDLIGKLVVVPANSAFHHRLLNLSKEIGGDIIVNTTEDYETEDLIAMVSRGEIEFTIAYENTAELDKSFYKNIDVSVPISFPQRVAWGFRKTSPNLKNAADEWLTKIRRQAAYNTIYNKYYRNSSLQNSRRNSQFYVLETGAISPYDALFKKHEKLPLITWTLLASMAYQESRFDHSAESWAGAQGLMQVMPATGVAMGFPDISTPEKNLRAGIKFLEFVHRYYWKDMQDTSEMIKFMLASYNAGPGHVKDAQRLAGMLGLDSLKWDDNVAVAIRKLSNPEYYYRPEIKHGYCRGDEPFFYVKEIVDRKRMYDGILEATAAKKSAEN
jgi:membrane-bound lytic murein transglycosylase F